MTEQSPIHSSTTTPTSSPAKAPLAPATILMAIAAIVILGFLYTTFNTTTSPTSTNNHIDSLTNQTSTTETTAVVDNTPLNTRLSKARYLKEVYKIDRDSYNLYEKAAQNGGKSLEETTQFFYDCCGLSSEEDIFAQLPSIPTDFPEVAYDLATGRLFQIAALGPEYYKQPEFYFNGRETSIVNRYAAFAGWFNVYELIKYWGDYGLTAYPSDQSDTVSKSGRDEFSSAVFITNGWNIQNYVGINLVSDSASKEFFDIEIAEESTGKPYFLLGPTFPVFDEGWATKVMITGKVKSGTPPGTYTISINPIVPPSELNNKWSDEHQGIYAPYGFVVPQGGYVTLNITVTE